MLWIKKAISQVEPCGTTESFYLFIYYFLMKIRLTIRSMTGKLSQTMMSDSELYNVMYGLKRHPSLNNTGFFLVFLLSM